LEAAGVVFLPSAGYRNAKNITGGDCTYWSSTPDSNDTDKAYCLYVKKYENNQSTLWSKGTERRGNGSSIRLVKTVE